MSTHVSRWATGLVVLAVAVIAAIVSFSHIESLALANGYSIATARLLPFSVDGLIVAASMALATGTRTTLARTSLVLGVAATVLANVMFGVCFGVTGAVVNSWPALSFILASEILIGALRSRPVAVPETVTDTVLQDVVETVPEIRVETVPADVPEIAVSTVPASTVPPVPEQRPRTVAARPASALATRAKRQPDPVKVFATELAAGRAPSLRSIKERMHVGTPAAQEIRVRLVTMIETPQAA